MINIVVSFRLLRLEDNLRGHHFYFKAAKLAIEVCCAITTI